LPTFALALRAALLARRAICTLLFEEFIRQCAFSATKVADGSLLKKMRPNAINGAITLRRWNMNIPILRVALATAKKRRPPKHSLL
jgi:hypothetical protein